MHGDVFHEIAFLLVFAAVVGLLGSALRQPVVVSFIVVGIAAAALLESAPETIAQITFLAELGVAILLFLVGLTLDWRLVRALGPVAVATGLGQVAFTAGIGFVLGLALGMDAPTSLYVAVALTFSSTIIIVKLLSDKRELETLHGRIALGFLIVQDLVVVVAMVALSTLGIGAAERGSPLGVLGMLGLNRLPTPHHPVFNEPRFERATRDRFFLCIKARDEQFDPQAVRQFLKTLHPLEVMDVEA